jgi:SAM-dependent methyltransferase
MKKFGVENYDKYWENRIEKKHFKVHTIHLKIVEVVGTLLENTRDARVLDCGVGPGHVFRMLSEKFDTHGLEISEKAFELYDFDTSKIRMWNLNDGLPEDFAESMDVVIASRIIHHLDDPVDFLGHVKRTLKPGGWFIGVIPNIAYYHHRLKFLAGTFPPISSAHINFQTGPVFQAMVEESGLQFTALHTPKKTIRARFWPLLFSQDLLYVFRKI